MSPIWASVRVVLKASSCARVNDENDKGTDNLDSVKLLLWLGADFNAKGGKHRNAINAASAGGQVKVVQCLLDAGVDIEFLDGHYGNSVQMAAFAEHADVLRLLAEAGVDVNATSAYQGTALVSAAQNAHAGIVQLLFELGVPTGDTYEVVEVVNLLIENGAVTDNCSTISTNPCCTPLEAAAVKGNLDMVRLWLDLGADVNIINDKKYGTSLIAACRLKVRYSCCGVLA
ncbi:hypothetical protein N7447_003232 [Penicillium robsamsonii]|uniref:uncharacterized protein n=1 Tax=Penicillium robsamsonii TaxID=1792511 RepID=UPI002548C122|nr:uncharacterized protein N7447_003232 [Penicillium robsamsonii]KAJ5826469.1 hypothetical protein N7447_003232 [Penicillium robsamsonii]